MDIHHLFKHVLAKITYVYIYHFVESHILQGNIFLITKPVRQHLAFFLLSIPPVSTMGPMLVMVWMSAMLLGVTAMDVDTSTVTPEHQSFG